METKQTQDQKYNCYDCGKTLSVNEKDEILDGKFLMYMHQGNKICIFKCNECYDKSPELTEFQECEIYSRIVGYIRPTRQWNKGKQQEFKERKNFKVK